MTNCKCKIFSIFLALTLVLSSVGAAFAFYIPPEDNAPLGGNWIVDKSGVNNYNSVHPVDNVTLRKVYTGAYGQDWGVGFPSNAPEGSVTWAYTFEAISTNSNQTGAVIGNVAASGTTSALPVNNFALGADSENVRTLEWQGYPRCILGDGESRFTLSFTAPASVEAWNLYIMPNSTTLATVDFTLKLVSVFGDGICYYGEDGNNSPIETFSFTVPYGSDLKITGKDVQTVLVRASTTRRGTLGNFFQKFNLSDIRYSAASDFEKSIPVPLSGAGKPSLTGGYSEFAGYCVPSNSFTIYNRVGNSNNISVDVYVNVTGRNIKGVYYSPQTNQDILDGVSSPTSENGDFAVTGGSGTPEDPYVTNPVNDDGVPISYDSLTPVIDNSPSDGVQNELLNRLDSIFAIPSRVASSVSAWIAGLAQLTTALYSAFPPIITDLFVAFFSIVVLIGLVKMFL